jgi:hypothetical protein
MFQCKEEKAVTCIIKFSEIGYIIAFQ